MWLLPWKGSPYLSKYSWQRFKFVERKEAHFSGKFPHYHSFNGFPNGTEELDASHFSSLILFSALN